MSILLTGGAGYIGSHTALELLRDDDLEKYSIIIVDSLNNSTMENVNKLCRFYPVRVFFYKVDLLDELGMEQIFNNNNIKAVLHFAGLKAVGESVDNPLLYYENNMVGTVNLLKIMEKYKCYNIIFSSSATVYGNTDKMPITEDINVSPISPYGRTKYYIEQILEDLYHSKEKSADKSNQWNMIILRYFNPVSKDKTGILRENPKGKGTNLFPVIMDVINGEKDKLSVFGNDYTTYDGRQTNGTPIRDYIHISDLAKAHVLSLKYLFDHKGTFEILNVGTGTGYTVLEVIQMFYKITGEKIPYEILGRREGDSGESFASPDKIHKLLGWKAEYGLEDMVKHLFL